MFMYVIYLFILNLRILSLDNVNSVVSGILLDFPFSRNED